MDEQLEVKFGGNIGGLKEAGDAAENEINRVRTSTEKATKAAAALREQIARTFAGTGNGLTVEAKGVATAVDRAKAAAVAANASVLKLGGGFRVLAAESKAAGTGMNQAAAGAKNAESSLSGLRTVAAGVGAALAVIGVRQFVQDSKDAAFAQFGFKTALSATTGDAGQAAYATGFIADEAHRLGLVVKDATDSFVGLAGATRGTALQGEKTRQIWLGVTEAGIAMNRSNEQLKRGQEAIAQIASKGVVSMEEIRQQLAEAIPGATQIAARAMGMTTQEFNKLVGQGKVMSDDFLPKFAARLRSEFAAPLEAAMNSPLGQARRALAETTNAVFTFKAAFGTGFLTGMTDGLRQFAAELSDGSGLSQAEQLGKSLAQALTLAGNAAIFLVQHVREIETVAALVAGGMLVRWLITVANEARLAAAAFAMKAMAAEQAAALTAAGLATENAAAVGLNAALVTQAREQVAVTEAALAAARAHEAAAAAAVAETRALLAESGAVMTYAERTAIAAAATTALAEAETMTAAAAGRAAVAQAGLTMATSTMGTVMLTARGALSAVLGLVGGPWGAAFLAAGAAVYYLTRYMTECDRELAELHKRTQAANVAMGETEMWAYSAAGGIKAFAGTAADSLTSVAALTGEVDKLADANYRLAASYKEKELQRLVGQLSEQNSRRDELVRARDKAVARSGGTGQIQGVYDVDAPPSKFRQGIQQQQDKDVAAPYNRDIATTDSQINETSKRIENLTATPLSDSRLNPAASAPPSGTPGGKPKKGPSQVAQWQDELDKKLIAEKAFYGDSTETEIAFWEQKRALTKAGGQDRLEVDRKLFQLRKGLANEDLQDQLADIEAKKQAAEGDRDEQMRLEDEKLSLLASTYGEDSKQYKQALKEKERMSQEFAQEDIRINRERIAAKAQQDDRALQSAQTVAETRFQTERNNIEALARMGQISQAEKLRRLAEVNQRERELELTTAEAIYQIDLKALKDQLAIEGLKPEAKAEINRRIEDLEAEHQARMAEIRASNEAGKQSDTQNIDLQKFEDWSGRLAPIGEGFRNTINNMITHAQTFGQVWQNVGLAMVDQFAQWVAKMATDWLAAEAMKILATTTGETTRTGIAIAGEAARNALTVHGAAVHAGVETGKTAATAAGEATRLGLHAGASAAGLAITIASGIKEVAVNAIKAATGAYAALAGIPVIGPFIAPAAAAAALAAVYGIGKSIASAEGGWDRVPYDGAITELHKDEMVLPRGIAGPMREAIGRMSGPTRGEAMAVGRRDGGNARQAQRTDSKDLAQQLFELKAAMETNAGGIGSLAISAVDSKSFERLIANNSGVLERAIDRALRNRKYGAKNP